jgi:hypothetical protein
MMLVCIDSLQSCTRPIGTFRPRPEIAINHFVHYDPAYRITRLIRRLWSSQGEPFAAVREAA